MILVKTIESVIQLDNVSMKFKKHIIFEDLYFQCQANEIIGIVGENGSGKSVLFKLISGFIIPDKGNISVNGINITRNNALPDKLGVLIEEPSFLEDITGFENLKLLSSIKNEISDADIFEILSEVGLIDRKDEKVKHYSLGMKKKLGIAQAIMEKQEVILLDEPMNALDEESVEKMRSLFKKIATKGATILIASHNKEDINKLCDKVYRIKDNKLENIEFKTQIEN
ncbi:multidrug ABC transporter ATP-binding protein [Enterococcus sp. CR-Ec1]|nr:multidrug ABC transporter ATP-binding protein [Enterococcus sp. CR-Ec1]